MIVIWLVALAAGAAVAAGPPPRISQHVAAPGSDSDRATALLAHVMPGGPPDTETIAIRGRTATLRDPALRQRVNEIVTRVGKVPGVLVVLSPYAPGGISLLSANGRAASVTVVMKTSALKLDLGAVRRVISTATAYNGPDLQVDVSGPGATVVGQSHLNAMPFLLAVFASVLILCLACRSPAAVAVCAGSGAAATFGVAATLLAASVHTSVDTLALLLAVVLGFGVSLSGAVLVVWGTQTALREGMSIEDAVGSAMRSSGRGVVYGSTGIGLAMAGTVLVRLVPFDGTALGALAEAITTSLVVVTLLPAMLGVAGDRLLVWTERTVLRSTDRALPRRAGFRTWWAGTVHEHPRVVAVGALIFVLGLAGPMIGLRIGAGDGGVDPTSMTTRRAYDLLSRDFQPGVNGPLALVAEHVAAKDKTTIPTVVRAVAATPGVASAKLAIANPHDGLALLEVIPDGVPRSAATSDLVRRLRSSVLPAATAGTGVYVHVGGQTPLFDDTAAQFTKIVPIFVGFELAAVFVMVLIGLRRPDTAAVVTGLSLLATGATLGVVRLLFQTGGLAGLIGVQTGPIEPYLLVFVLVGVFSLSVGMQLCLPNRVADTGARGGHDRGAVRSGHADLGHVAVTGAAILVTIFIALGAQEARTLKVLGLGLAAGVFIDALIIRSILLPAALHLLSPAAAERSIPGPWITEPGIDGTRPTVPVGRIPAPRTAAVHVSPRSPGSGRHRRPGSTGPVPVPTGPHAATGPHVATGASGRAGAGLVGAPVTPPG